MTIFAAPTRRRPASHAFTVPVVRELAPRGTQLAAGSIW
jgi:hypothetical protein